MPRKSNGGSTKTPPRRQRPQRQTTQLGELDTTPTRPDTSPNFLAKQQKQNGGTNRSFSEKVDSDAFDDGIEDVDLVQLADTQALPNTLTTKGFSWSETGSVPRRSSSVSSDVASKSVFGYMGVDTAFSSPASENDELPDTVPLPIGLPLDPLLGEKGHQNVNFDFSETATTILRSSPLTVSRLSKRASTSSRHGSASYFWDEEVIVEKTPPLASSGDNSKKAEATDQKTGTQVEPVAGGIVSTNITLGGDPSANIATHDTQKSNDQGQADATTTTHRASSHGAADRLDDEDSVILDTIEVANSVTRHKKKRKQRPKTPLQFDDDTQAVRTAPRKPSRKKRRQEPKPQIIKRPASSLESANGGTVEVITLEGPSLDDKSSAPLERDALPVEIMEVATAIDTKMRNSLEIESLEHCKTQEAVITTPEPQNDTIPNDPEPIKVKSHAITPSVSDVNMQESKCISSTIRQANLVKNQIATIASDPIIEEISKCTKLTGLPLVANGDNCTSHTIQADTGTHSLEHGHNQRTSHESEAATTTSSQFYGKSITKRDNSICGDNNFSTRRPCRRVSVTGQGSPIRALHLGDIPFSSLPASISMPLNWSVEDRDARIESHVVETARHESSRSSSMHCKPKTSAPLEVKHSHIIQASPVKLIEQMHTRPSILSELKKSHINRRNVTDQAKGHSTDPGNRGTQQLHQLIDACIQHLDSKKDSIAQISETYTKAGNHCVDRIQSRFERERSAVVRQAIEDVGNFNRLVFNGINSAEEKSAKHGLLMKQFKHAFLKRAAWYGHAASALEKLHHAMLPRDNGHLDPES